MHLDRRARRALRRRARVEEPGALRRAEAALDERPLHPRARRRRADARGSRRYTGRDGAARRRSRSAREKIQTLADFWPLAGFLFDGPADDPKAREKWLGDGGRGGARGGARRRWPRLEPFDAGARRGGAARRRRARAAAKPKDVFQPMRVALAGTTVSPGIFEIARRARARRGAARDRRRAGALLIGTGLTPTASRSCQGSNHTSSGCR